jgi:hypothetical protein
MADYVKNGFGKDVSVGMDEELMRKDRSGFKTTTDMLLGGVFQDALIVAGADVGNPYDDDLMGEDYNGITYNPGTLQTGTPKKGKTNNQPV